jgi:hypothetical protein
MMPSNHFNDQPLMFHEQPSFLGEQDMAGGGAAQILASQLLPPETATSNFTGSATPSESSMTVPRTGNFSASTPSPENIRAKRRTPEQIIESRLQRRRERNRLAAQKSRQRRLSYIQELEERLEHYEQEITHLRQVLQSSHQVICDLRIQLENKP